MPNNKHNRFSRRLVPLYAWIAVILICSFQGYWLYSTYTAQKKQLKGELENSLKEYVLENDTRSLLSRATSGTGISISPEALTNQPINPVKGVDVEIRMLGNDEIPINDSLVQKAIDSVLAVSNIPNGETQLADKYIGELKSAYPDIRFGLYSNGKSYPEATDEKADMAVTASSQLNPLDLHTLKVYNHQSIILDRMWGAIAISLVYLLICLSAVYLLLRNIRKNRLLMDSKDNFTQNMTHELKTPIATLSAAAEALSTYNFLDNKEVAREYIDIMVKDIKKLDNMTSAILANARLTANTIAMDKETLAVDTLITDVLANFKPRIQAAGAQVSVKADSSLIIRGDRLHLGNVLSNLIDNALKYSDATPAIHIIAERHGNTACIIVEDSGMGIPAAYHKEIFKPYVRVHEGDLHNVKGFGIGLTYAREIVERHSGTLKLLWSEQGRGTKFEIILPLYEH